MNKSIITRLHSVGKWQLWSVAVVMTTLMTSPIVAGMNFLLEGQITRNFLLTGFIASILAASVVSGLIIHFQALFTRIKQDNLQVNSIVSACPIPIAINDDTQQILLINPEFSKVFGYTSDDIPNLQDWWTKAYPEAEYRHWVTQTWQLRLSSMMSTGNAFDPLEVQICCKDGKIKTVLTTATLLDKANPGMHLVVLYDITENARATQALLESRNMLQSIIESIPMRVFWKDLDSRYLGCNTAFANDGGKTNPAEIVGKLDTEMTWRDQAKLYRTDDQAVMVSGCSKLAFEEPQTTPNGDTIWLRTSKLPLRDKSNQTMGVLGIYEDITDIKRIERELWLSKTMLDKSSTAFFRLSPAGKVVYVNDFACRSLGYSRGELLGMYAWNFDPDFTAAAWPAVWHKLKQDKSVNIETRHRRKDGSMFNVDVTGHYINYNDEEFSFTFVQDVTERKRLETELRVAATAFESQEGIVITDANSIILKINQSFTNLTGFTNDDVVGREMSVLKSGIQDAAFYTEMWASILEKGYWQGEVWNRRKNGDIYPEWLTITAVKDDHGRVSHYVGTMFDITVRKAIEDKVHRLAHYDVLTNLPNRTLLSDRLHQALAQARREKGKLALMFLDLDKFKFINDKLGHGIGDLLLHAVAQRLQSCMRRESDTVARVGGDEFIVLLAHIGDKKEAVNVAEKVIQSIGQPFNIEQHSINISTSIGIAVYPSHGVDATSLMKLADIAMYQAKEAGRGRFQFYFSGISGVSENQ